MTDSEVAGYKNRRGGELQFSNEHCEYPTEFQQTVANFQQKRYMDGQNFDFAPKFPQNGVFINGLFSDEKIFRQPKM